MMRSPARACGRAPEGLELAVVLDHAELLDEALTRHELDASLPQLLGERPREDVGLEAEAAREVLTEPADQRPLRLHGLDAVDAPRSLDVAEVGEEAHPVRLNEERGVRAVEAGQVADVDEIRDQQRLLEELAQPFDPASQRIASLRCSRASL